uniref:Uncharacterized protein n=1 Tax=Varanus komodoensis TaxID=61221 RepID=A0A8D2Q6L6_VARKO
MWLWLALAVLAYFVIRWYRERQTVDNLREKHVLITGCDSGFGNQLARQLDLLGLRVLAACLTQEGADKMEEVTSDRLKTTILDVTSTESVAAATEWVKEQVGHRVHKMFFGSWWINKDMHLVTDCMEHALISRYPRTRYAAGWDSKFIFIPLSYLPASWVDYITTYSGVKPAKALY